jgi:hypothetical protein
MPKIRCVGRVENPWPGYVSQAKESRTTTIKGRTRLKRLGGHYMSDQFGQELFPGTISLKDLAILLRITSGPPFYPLIENRGSDLEGFMCERH